MPGSTPAIMGAADQGPLEKLAAQLRGQNVHRHHALPTKYQAAHMLKHGGGLDREHLVDCGVSPGFPEGDCLLLLKTCGDRSDPARRQWTSPPGA